MARSFNVSPLVVGLTVIAFGTSAPEMVVSVLATLGGQGDVAIGNIVGSNTINIALILGVATLIAPIRVETQDRRPRDADHDPRRPCIAPPVVGRGLGRLDGVIMLAGFAGYMIFVLRTARAEPAAIGAEFEEFEEAIEAAPRGEPRVWDFILILGGLLTLVAGAQCSSRRRSSSPAPWASRNSSSV